MEETKLTKSKFGFLQPIYTLIWNIFWRGSIVIGSVTGLYNSLWKPTYLFLAFLYRNGVAQLPYMNYGYVPSNEEEEEKLLKYVRKAFDTEDPKDKNHIFMYEKTLSLCPLYPDFSGKELLEVGAGHGGGVQWICKAHPELKSVRGMDLTVVDTLGGKIFKGDAMDIPIEKDSVDLVLNVETSHCYSSQTKYFNEVMRILKPGGYHLWADMRAVDPVGPLGFDYNMDELWRESKEAGFELIDSENITKNVIQSLTEVQFRMQKLLQSRWYTRLVGVVWQNFWAIPGSSMNRDFVEGRFTYNVICWRKACKLDA